MELDRYCNICLSYYNYDVDSQDSFQRCTFCGSDDTDDV